MTTPASPIPAHLAGITEFWTIPTRRGARAYYYSCRAGRALPLPIAVAQILEATGQATNTGRPAWVGGRR